MARVSFNSGRLKPAVLFTHHTNNYAERRATECQILGILVSDRLAVYRRLDREDLRSNVVGNHGAKERVGADIVDGDGQGLPNLSAVPFEDHDPVAHGTSC